MTTLQPHRISSVDALRGFALLAIVLLHNLEHYNIFGAPAAESPLLKWLDSTSYDFIFFIFAGKAYATFSLLFGFSFFIQLRNARSRGNDFRARFAWRMFLLFCFSQLHALFYNGDILLLYSVCGLILIPASSWSDKKVLVVASILMLQPFAWGKIIYALFNPQYIDTNSMFYRYAAIATETGQNGNLIETLADNIWNGQLYSNFWQVEAGRLFQTPALFLFGMWLGRKNLFVQSDTSRRFWISTLKTAGCTCVPLFMLCRLAPPHIDNVTILSYYSIALPMIYNFSFMAMLVSAFMLVWFKAGDGRKWQRFIIPYGKMSLTNYIFQSIIGVTLYYHFGFGLFDKVGAFGSVCIACAIFAFQLGYSRLWLRTHPQGPLEDLWKRGTWLNWQKTQSAATD